MPDGRNRERGFALLIVITLLSFVVILLVGLAAYTRVETAVAGNTQRQAQARENALLGLNVALRQLQKYAGPDQRVTATAAAFPNGAGTRHYTGVWSSDPATGSAPLTWLVSGNEFAQPDTSEGAAEGSTIPAPLAVTPETTLNPTTGVALVSTNTSRTANDVLARLVPVTATGVPGVAPAASATIGRYAWWVGDQGVKAPVAVPDATNSVAYAPFDSADLRARIRQQIALGAGAADTAGAPVFEPRDTNNTPLVANEKIVGSNQLAFLKNAGNTALGLTRSQQNFHAWSFNNFAVLANTKLGGLRQDLSLAPSLLGGAFAAWANYAGYMESPQPPAEGTPAIVVPPAIQPAYGSDPLRRRYVMTPHLIADNGAHQVGPVLTYFLITFNVRTQNGSSGTRALEVRARWMVSLWNPYSSALVPEDLQIDVSRLPTSVRVVNDTTERAGPIGSFSLSSEYGSPLRINLPWSASATDDTPTEDRQSWLPGRVYSWRSAEDTSKGSSPPFDGYASDFYLQTLSKGGDGVIRPLAGKAFDGNLDAVDSDDPCHLEVDGSETLGITIYALRPTGRVRLAALNSPDFVSNFSTTPQRAGQSGYQFSYVFRLAESIDTPAAPGTWLTTFGRDVRRRTLPSESYVVAENGNDPAQYGDSYSKIRNPDRLLDRATDSYSYNEDVPVFELPRSPILSLGALQHFRQPGQRPFMIGNPWGAGYELNGIRTAELFDRFFFSGLVDGVTPGATATGDLILPNPLLKPLRKPDQSKVTIDDVRALMNPPTTTTIDPDGNEVTTPTVPASSHSSKFLLQGGAFNLNSTNAAAWAAVLRGVRFPSPQSFTYLNVSTSTGTAADAENAMVQSGDAQFFRFSQSAQETFKAEPGMAESSPNAADPSPANTHLFRRGMRTLSAAEVGALAAKIAELMGAKHAAEGPYRSMDEFLSPAPLFAGVDSEGNAGSPRSLLEAAIADAGVNADVAEFSSQWLTQGDVMTALASVLFPRSDTFLIRAYGEAVNPATNATEGKAWCEALVQRLPEYFDPGDPPETAPGAFDTPTNPDDPDSQPTGAHQLNKLYGRRFKVLSFRWLTLSDI
ncbi:MAG: hypothetical protein HY736_08670 [Verrucomicrobia bacterium]|nr:hypothetical protein [Verrucomicrobiota bacterium]